MTQFDLVEGEDHEVAEFAGCHHASATVAWWHPARVAVQTLLLLPTLFPSAPLDPLSLVTRTPMRRATSRSRTSIPSPRWSI